MSIPLDREALLPQIGPVQELLEPLHLREAVERAQAVLVAESRKVRGAFHLVPEPRDLDRVLEVFELVAERAACRSPEGGRR